MPLPATAARWVALGFAATAAAAIVAPRRAFANPAPPRDAVVEIEAGHRSGTGFVFDSARGALIATACHVVGTDAVVFVVTRRGERIAAEIVARDRALDLAVLRPQRSAASSPLVLATDGRITVGESTTLVGHPYGLDGLVTEGRIVAIGSNAVVSDALSAPGNSGGPMLGPDGRVIGVVYARSRARPHRTYAARAEDLAALVEGLPRRAASLPGEGRPVGYAGTAVRRVSPEPRDVGPERRAAGSHPPRNDLDLWMRAETQRAAHPPSRPPPQLDPDGAGGFVWRGPSLTARIDRDGTLRIPDGNTAYAEQLFFLDRTESLRELLMDRARARWSGQSLSRLARDLAWIGRNLDREREVAATWALVLELREECGDLADGRQARGMIDAFIVGRTRTRAAETPR